MSLLFAADHGAWNAWFHPLGAMQQFVTEDKELPIGSWYTPIMQDSHLAAFGAADGYKGATRWYRMLVTNASLEEEKVIADARLEQPSIIVADAQSMPPQMGMLAEWVPNLTPKELASGHWTHIDGIVAYLEHEWMWEKLLAREPQEDEFLVEMIATDVCHMDISGYGGIYPRVLGHEVMLQVIPARQLLTEPQAQEGLSGFAAKSNAVGHPAYCVNHAVVTPHANEPNFVLARDPYRVIGGGYFWPVELRQPRASQGFVRGQRHRAHQRRRRAENVRTSWLRHHDWRWLHHCAAKKKLGVKIIIAVDLLDSRIQLARRFGDTHRLNPSPKSLRGLGLDLAAALCGLKPDALRWLIPHRNILSAKALQILSLMLLHESSASDKVDLQNSSKMALFSQYDMGTYNGEAWFCGCGKEAKFGKSSQESSKGEEYLRCIYMKTPKDCNFFLTMVDEPQARLEKSSVSIPAPPKTPVSQRTIKSMLTPNTASSSKRNLFAGGAGARPVPSVNDSPTRQRFVRVDSGDDEDLTTVIMTLLKGEGIALKPTTEYLVRDAIGSRVIRYEAELKNTKNSLEWALQKLGDVEAGVAR
ncbi:hypothetical protein NLG97_g8261 [Lecanicillium saksenae]|uniref:Uncharacterized protein n=1 Tax=Lecanicillium saksenae TaxID=468837 RepID=A0ACC1QJF4_9HYPO|nr:hypothetical protein NLG97_g8261 [Lecanicillium saksenae]